MVDIKNVIDIVSVIVSQCSSHSGSSEVPQLDMDLLSLISASTQVGSLLDEILVTRQRDVEGRVLADLRQLHMCLNQLCLEYQTKLFNSMSGVNDPATSCTSVALDGPARGRPKKVINVAFVCNML